METNDVVIIFQCHVSHSPLGSQMNSRSRSITGESPALPVRDGETVHHDMYMYPLLRIMLLLRAKCLQGAIPMA